MNENENTARCWEDFGSWENRAALCGDSISKRLEAVRLAVLERCERSGEPAPTLEKTFPLLWSITDAMQSINSELKRILPYFIAVDEGKIRKLTLLLPDGVRKTWEQVPVEDFSDTFEQGTITLHAGKLSLTVTGEGDLTGLTDARFSLYAECFTEEELIQRFPVFLPHSGKLSLFGDWLFGIHRLLKELILPMQEISVSFRQLEGAGAVRDFTLYTCPEQNEWRLSGGDSGTGTLSEEDAWSRMEESPIDYGFAEIRRLETEYTGNDGEDLFGSDVPYTGLEVSASDWNRLFQNDSCKVIARTVEPLPLHLKYECRHDSEDDLLFLSGSYAKGAWQVLADQKLEGGGSVRYGSAPISRPSSGYGARTDRYRRFTLKVECPFDSCGLQFR